MPGKIMRVATALMAVVIYCSCTKKTDTALDTPGKNTSCRYVGGP